MVPGLDRIKAMPWPEQPQTSGSRWDLLNASLKARFSMQEKPHASPVDRRVSLMDSLIVRVEMALLTNGMRLARIETVGGNQLDGCGRPNRPTFKRA